MKSYIKCAVSVVLMIMISIYCCIPAFGEIFSENVIAALAERGYPIEILRRTPEEELYVLLENHELLFGGAVIVTGDRAMKNVQVFEFSADEAVPVGDIETDSVSIMLVTANVMKDGEVDSAYIYAAYEWTNLPLFRSSDPISLSWDGNMFGMKDHTFYCVSEYDCRLIPELPAVEAYNYAASGDSGVSWYAKLKAKGLFSGLFVTRLYGGAHVWLQAEDDFHGESGTCTVSITYSHANAQLKAQIDMSFPGLVFDNTHGLVYNSIRII